MDTQTMLSEFRKLQAIHPEFVIHPLTPPNDSGISPGKKPRIPAWQKLKATPPDMEKYIIGGCNLGLACGEASNITVIDFDKHLFMPQVFKNINIDTLTDSRTKGKGHMYFKYTPNLPSQKHHSLGIEIMGNGGNIVIPPSIHKSGDVYKWYDINTPIPEMPLTVIDNLNKLFKTEAELKILLAKCRMCFKKAIEEDIMETRGVHGAEGREYLIALCTDLKAKGATEEHIKMLALILYGKDYDEIKTLREWYNLKADRTWKCETLATKLPSYVNCAHCKHKEQNAEVDITEKTCRSCVFKPKGGLGSCKNDANISVVSKKKKQVVYDTPACTLFKDILPQQAVNTKKNTVSISTVAAYVMKKHPIITLIDNPREMYYYENGVYKYGGLIKVKEIAQAFLGELTSISFVDEVVHYIQNSTYVDRKDINKDKTRINLRNGLYNIHTKSLEQHSPELWNTCQLPIMYDSTATCPEISNFLCEVLRPRDIALMLQLMGYCFISDYSIQKAFLWNGSGLNGKGALGRLLVAMVGAENKSSESLKMLNTDRFSSSNLYGKHVNIDTDLNNEAVTDDTMFKKLTGGDPIPAERKNQNRFEFINEARLIFGCNDIPQHIKGGYAWDRRWILIDFPVRFEGTIEDKNLDYKLTTTKEKSGFFNMCIQALDWLLENKTFFYNKTPEQVSSEYSIKSNSVVSFMSDVTTIGEGCIKTTNLYALYVKWCKAKNLKKIEAPNVFGRLLKKAGFIQVRPVLEGKQVNAYDDIVINTKKFADLIVENLGAQYHEIDNGYKHWYPKLSPSNPNPPDLNEIILICKSDKDIDNDLLAELLGYKKEEKPVTIFAQDKKDEERKIKEMLCNVSVQDIPEGKDLSGRFNNLDSYNIHS